MQPYYADPSVTIYHGDCREVLPDLALYASRHTLVTDPPYGFSYASNRRDSDWRGEQIANDDDTEARDWLLEWWGEVAPALVFGSWKRPRPGGTRHVLIWDKGESVGMGDLTLPWKPNYEEIYVIGVGFSGHRGSSILRYPTHAHSTKKSWKDQPRQHPNEKPVGLMIDLIGKCPAGGILDPFMGSGTTLLAAKDLGRHAIGIELEERYCEIAARRCGQEVLVFGAVQECIPAEAA